MAIDAQWDDVVLFMPMDSDGIVDAKNHTPTLVGGIAVSATQSLTGGYSAYFDGTDDRITFSASADWDMSGGTFSFEFSIRPDALPSGANCRLFLIGTNGSASALHVSIDTTGKLYMFVPNGSPSGPATASGVVVAGAWNRFEISVNAGQSRIFKDGVLVAGPTTMTLPTSSSSNQLYIGWDTVATVNFKYAGYLDRLRFTKGSYRNIAAFTSDDDPFPRPMISGTVYDDLGAEVDNVVVALKRGTLALAGYAVSDAVTGEYTIYPSDYSEHIVMRFDTDTYPLVDGGLGENAIIYDRVIPG
jgi:hypothetical protein